MRHLRAILPGNPGHDKSAAEPNDLQFVPEGLWVLDQVDQPTNKAFLVKPEDGTVLREILTEALHASGITYGNGALWIGSTKARTHRTRQRR